MSSILERALAAFRDYETDGLPASGAHRPEKAEVRALFTAITEALGLVGSGGAYAVNKATLAELQAVAGDYEVGDLGLVYADDSDPSASGVYVLVDGTPDVWELTDIPYSATLQAVIDAVQPLVDEAADSADGAATSATAAGAAQTGAEAALAEAEDLFGVTPGVPSITWEDSDHNILATMTETEFQHPQIDEMAAQLPLAIAVGENFDFSPGVPSVDLEDSSGNLLMRITETDMRHPKIASLSASILTLNNAQTSQRNAAWDDVQAIAQLLHFILYGQSLSDGLNNTAISLTALTGGKRFVGGVRTTDAGGSSASNHASLVDLVEQNATGGLGETPAYGAAQMILQLAAADGISVADLHQTLLMSAAGESSKTAAQLATGSAYFDLLKDDITYGRARGDALSLSYDVGAILYSQGENDYSVNTAAGTWETTVRGIRTDAEAWRLSVTGRTGFLPMIMMQTGTHLFYSRATPSIALKQLEMASSDEFAMAGPVYFMPFTDQVHPTGTGEKWTGAYLGLVAYRWLFKGVKPVPLAPTRIDPVGKSLVATFPVDPGKKLVLDTDTVSAQTNYGLTMVDASDSAITITGVSLGPGPDKLTVLTGTTRVAGDKLRCAWIGDANKGLSNIRDNSGDTLIFDPSGINKPMHRWACIFEKAAI